MFAFCCCSDDKDAKLVDLHISPAVAAEDSPVLLLDEATEVQTRQAVAKPDDVPEVQAGHVIAKMDLAARVQQRQAQAPIKASEILSRTGHTSPPASPATDPVFASGCSRSPESSRTRGRDFKIPVLKPFKTSPIGLELDTVGGVCGMVMSIVDGAVMIYNTAATPEMQVRPGDFIMGVNGTMGSTVTMSRIASENISLELHFRRPEEYSVYLDRTGSSDSLGLELEYTSIGKTLLVSRLGHGVVTDWNRAHPENPISVYDRILEVNSVRGDAKRLLDLCSSSRTLDLRLIRIKADVPWL